MTATPMLVLLGVILAAATSFFFSLAETALFSLSKWQVRVLSERSPWAGEQVAKLLATPQDLVAVMALGNTVAGSSMMALALWMVMRGEWPVFITVVLILVLSLVVGEVLPKTLAVREPERWAVNVAPIITALLVLARPLYRGAQTLNEAILRLVIPRTVKPMAALTDEEYGELIELATQQGILASSEQEVLQRIIRLDGRTVKEIMRPRARMACVSDDLTVPEMVVEARRLRHRRLPMYDETPDTIVGVLNTRELLLNPDVDLAEVVEFPSFVPESMNLLQLLKSLQRQQRSLAVVLDEYGGTAGIITLEDILEELVGDIRAEGEAASFVMEELAPGRWRVNGTTRIDRFRLECPELPDLDGVETMGGLMVHLCDVVPARGTTTVYHGFQLRVQTADERRVRELVVERAVPGRAKGGAA